MIKKRLIAFLGAILVLSSCFSVYLGAAANSDDGRTTSDAILNGNMAFYINGVAQSITPYNGIKTNAVIYNSVDQSYILTTIEGNSTNFNELSEIPFTFYLDTGREYSNISCTYKCDYIGVDGTSQSVSIPLRLVYQPEASRYLISGLTAPETFYFISEKLQDYQFDLTVNVTDSTTPTRTYSDITLPTTISFNGSSKALASAFTKIRYSTTDEKYRLYDSTGNSIVLTNGYQISFDMACDTEYSSVVPTFACSYTYNGQSLTETFPATFTYNSTAKKYTFTITFYSSKFAFLARELKDFTMMASVTASNATTITIANTDTFTGFYIRKNDANSKAEAYGKIYTVPSDATTVKVYAVSYIDNLGLNEPTSVSVYNGSTKVKTYDNVQIDALYVSESKRLPYYYVNIPVSELANGYSIVVNYTLTLEEIDYNSENYKYGYEQGKSDGYKNGYDAGYQQGLSDATNTDGWLGFFDSVFGSLIFNAVYVLGGIGFGGITLLDIIVYGLLAVIIIFVIKALMK